MGIIDTIAFFILCYAIFSLDNRTQPQSTTSPTLSDKQLSKMLNILEIRGQQMGSALDKKIYDLAE